MGCIQGSTGPVGCIQGSTGPIYLKSAENKFSRTKQKVVGCVVYRW